MYARQKQVLESFVRVLAFVESHPAEGPLSYGGARETLAEVLPRLREYAGAQVSGQELSRAELRRQAEMITRQFGIPVTSPGGILRRERDLGTSLGLATAEITQRGGLVSDEIIVQLIEDWLRLHGAHGFVFDGDNIAFIGINFTQIVQV